MKYPFISRWMLLLAASLLMLVLPACIHQTPQADTLASPWAEPVDGLRHRIAAVPSILPFATMITVDVELKNVSHQPIQVPVPQWPFDAPGMLSLTRGDKVYCFRYHRPIACGPGADKPPVRLEPGQVGTFTQTLFINGRAEDGFADIHGIYTYKSEHHFQALPDFVAVKDVKPGAYELRYTHGKAVTSPVTVTVLQQPVAVVIDATIAQARDDTHASLHPALNELLIHLTCQEFFATEHLQPLDHFEAWWADHRDEPWQEWIHSALDSDDPIIRARASGRAYLLTRNQDRARLAEHLDPADLPVSATIFTALWINFQEPSIDFVTTFLKSDASHWDKHHLLYLIKKHKITPLHPLILERIELETDPDALSALMEMAHRNELENITEMIERVMARPDLGVAPQTRGVYALAVRKKTDYEDELITFLASPRPSVRAAAAWGLYHGGTAKAIPPLLTTLTDEAAKVVEGTCYALTELRTKMTAEQKQQAIAIINEALNDPNNPHLQGGHYATSMDNLRRRLKSRH